MNREAFSRRVLLASVAVMAASLPGNARAQNSDVAAERAIEISRLEQRRRLSDLYDLMHPDAQAFIPREVVIGWYNSYLPGFDALGELTVTGVDVIDWTWQVSGISYPNTAEVSFVQPLTRNGATTEVADVVRLVPVAPDDYRWFFGRNAEFVDEQIGHYARSAGSGEFTIERLGVLPGLDISSADVINDAGIVAGDASPFGNPGDRGFLYADGAMTAIDDLFGLTEWINYPRDINEAGVVVGGSAPFEGTFKPYIVSQSEFRYLPAVEGRNHAIAHGINDSGLIVGEAFGFYFDGRGNLPSQAIIWRDGDTLELLPAANAAYSDARAINDNGWIIGAIEEAGQSGRRAAVWREDRNLELEFLPPNPYGIGNTAPRAINNQNSIVGTAETPAVAFGGLPWIWRNGDAALSRLPLPAGVATVTGLSINDQDIVVGTGYGEGGTIGLIWRDGNVAELTALIDTGSFIVTEANDISANGLIAARVQAFGDPRSSMAAIISET